MYFIKSIIFSLFKYKIIIMLNVLFLKLVLAFLIK